MDKIKKLSDMTKEDWDFYFATHEEGDEDMWPTPTLTEEEENRLIEQMEREGEEKYGGSQKQ